MYNHLEILPTNAVPGETDLFVEVSSKSLRFFYRNNNDKMITGLSVFNVGGRNDENHIAGILANNEAINRDFRQVFVCYAFNESILTPATYYRPDQVQENLTLIFGDLYEKMIFTDHIAEPNIHNSYTVPRTIHGAFTDKFANATFLHSYSLLLRQLPGVVTLLKAVFYQNTIVIVLQNEGKLQIIQSFSYLTVNDALYHMLNVCERFAINNTHVELHGMIDKDSALYTEIEKYFSTVTLAARPPGLLYDDNIQAQPEHYYSNLFAFALCV